MASEEVTPVEEEVVEQEEVVEEQPEIVEEADPELEMFADEEPPVEEVPEVAEETPEVAEEPVVEEVEPTQEEMLAAQVEALQAELQSLAAFQHSQQSTEVPANVQMVQPEAPQQETPTVEANVPQQPAPQPQAAAEVLPLVQAEEYDRLFAEPEVMNTVLNRTMHVAANQVLQHIPAIVQNIAREQLVLQSSIEEFYKQNEDLRPVSNYVGVVANDVVAKHADWNLAQVLDESAKVVRAKMRLNKKLESDAPAVAKTPTARATPKKMSEDEKAFKEMLALDM